MPLPDQSFSIVLMTLLKKDLAENIISFATALIHSMRWWYPRTGKGNQFIMGKGLWESFIEEEILVT